MFASVDNDSPIDHSLGCKTKSEKHTSHEDEKTNKTCVFPFYFKRFKYTKCTDIEEGFFWCSTKVDEDTHDHIGGNWGTCDSDEAKCPKTGGMFTLNYLLIYQRYLYIAACLIVQITIAQSTIN